MGLPVRADGIGEFQIGAFKEIVNIVRTGGDLSRAGQQRLLLRGEDVRLSPADIAEGGAVFLQARRLRVKLFQRFLRDRNDLRRGVGAGHRKLYAQTLRLGMHVLIGGHGGVLVGFQARVAVDKAQRLADALAEVQIFQQHRAALAETALIALHLRDQLICLVQRVLPRRVVGEDGRQVPLIRGIGLRAGLNFQFCHETGLLFCCHFPKTNDITAAPGLQRSR